MESVMKTIALVSMLAVVVIVTVTAADWKAPRTAWGDPDLQGIWTNEFETPLQRSAKYANREFFTDAEIAEFDKEVWIELHDSVGVKIQLNHPAIDAIRIKLLVPRCVEGIGEVYTVSVAADLHHLRTAI